jgi:DNA replication and repair protein RecF
LGLLSVKIEKFRCLESAELELDPRINLITGENGAGKTSILEAIFFLGRGRSFRAGATSGLIQAGCDDFTVFGALSGSDGDSRIGIRVGRKNGRDIHIDGQPGGQTADLIAAFPVQIIDPEVHHLVQGGPEDRRRFLDWGVFHVKHSFLATWQRYRRALQQRNTALRHHAGDSEVGAWDNELIEAARQVDAERRDYLDGFEAVFTRISAELLDLPANCRYLPGWAADAEFGEALEASKDRDRQHGLTHVGPHRAELVLEIDGTAARHRLSRGQQKLLGISLVLAQSEFVSARTDRDVALLVDEPAAELDAGHLENLVDALRQPRIQLFMTALRDDALPGLVGAEVFHVKHGFLSP